MEKRYCIFALLVCVQLYGSSRLAIPKNLGKPPLAPKILTVQQRIDHDFANYSNLYPDKSNTEIFELLLENAAQALSGEQHWLLEEEWQTYQDLIWQKMEQIENFKRVTQKLNFDKNNASNVSSPSKKINIVSKELEYLQEAQNILDRERLSLTSKDYKKRVKELRDLTGQALLNDKIPLEEVCRLQVAFNVFSGAYQSLK